MPELDIHQCSENLPFWMLLKIFLFTSEVSPRFADKYLSIYALGARLETVCSAQPVGLCSSDITSPLMAFCTDGPNSSPVSHWKGETD